MDGDTYGLQALRVNAGKSSSSHETLEKAIMDQG